MKTSQSNKAAKLAAAARSAAEVRAYQVDPDVVALRVERVRAWVDRLIWTGLILGLLFTMANVAAFAAQGTRAPWSDNEDASVTWVTAWLLDPMVSLVLIGVLMGEQVINRYELKAGGWVRATKWVALGCTYSMNTWSSWEAQDPAAILLHSVPVVIVFCAAEAVVSIRQRITEAVDKAYGEAVKRAEALRAAQADPTAEPTPEPTAGPVTEPAGAAEPVMVDPTPTPQVDPTPEPVTVDPDPVAEVDPTPDPLPDSTPDPTPARAERRRSTRPARRAVRKADPAPAFPADMVARALELHQEHLRTTGRPVGADRLRETLRIKAARARDLRDHIRALPAPTVDPTPEPTVEPVPVDPTPAADPQTDPVAGPQVDPTPVPSTDPAPAETAGVDSTPAAAVARVDLTKPSARPSAEPDPTPDPDESAGRELALIGGER